MKPYIHCQLSVKKYKGSVEDYMKIHEWFDQTKAFIPDMRHRSILHNAFGIYLCQQVFGFTITNSDDKIVSVRDIGEDHVLQDLGTIPTLQDCLGDIEMKDWFGGKHPPKLDLSTIDIRGVVDAVIKGKPTVDNADDQIFLDSAKTSPFIEEQPSSDIRPTSRRYRSKEYVD